MNCTVKVTCNNPNCGFVGYYHHTNIQQIKQHRQIFSQIPVAGDECPHADVTIIEVD